MKATTKRTLGAAGVGFSVGAIGAAILSACSSDPSTAASVPTPEIKSPAFDASPIGFDSSVPSGNDAANEEDAATLADGATPPAVITVLEDNVPAPSMKVVFQHSDGTVIETLTTDAKGQVSREAEDGLMVTVIDGSSLTTFVGVKPNDKLSVSNGPAPSLSYPVAATFPAAPGGTTKLYTVRAGNCSGANGATTVTLTANPNCVNSVDGTVPVLVSNLPGNGGSAPPGWTLLAKNTLAVGGATTTVDFTKVANGGWSSTYDTVTSSVANAPPGGGFDIWRSGISGGVSFGRGYVTPTYPSANTAQIIDSNVPRGFDAQQLDVVNATVNNTVTPSALAITVLAKRVNSTVLTADASTLLPRITGTLTDVSTALRPRITWSAAASLAGADGGYVRIYWAGVGKIPPKWTFVVPPGTTEVKAPALPKDLEGLAPPAGTTFSPPQIVFVESDQIANYDALRGANFNRSFEATITRSGVQSSESFVPALPVDATVRATAYAEWNN